MINFRVVLCGDQDSVDANRYEFASIMSMFLVSKNDLGLAIRSQPRNGPGMACVGQFLTKRVG